MAMFCNCMGGPNCCMNRPFPGRGHITTIPLRREYVSPQLQWVEVDAEIDRIDDLKPRQYDDADDMRC
jgi:hypothetical protein